VILLAALLAPTEGVHPEPPPSLASGVVIEEKSVVSGAIKLDPAKGYIFLTASSRQAGVFVREPDQQDIAAYRVEWEKQFAKAQKRYPDQLAQWRIDVNNAGATKASPPEKPVEPTHENFSIGDIAKRTIELFGPVFAFAKQADGGFSYLTAVKPGTYIWYGPVLMVGRDLGYGGFCYCMGSVKFAVRPGVVTDLGNFLTAAPVAEPQAEETTPAMIQAGGGWNGYKIGVAGKPSTIHYGLPASLNGWPSAHAEFSASGKQNNFFGQMVTRLPPIPGVLAYQRDTIIDVKTNTPVTTSTIDN
jgi:hypothetical protein